MSLLIVSNRLPVTVIKNEKKLSIRESSGGLVSGLSSYLDSLKGSSFPATADYVWIGWPGVQIGEKHRNELSQKLLQEYNAYPVFLSTSVMERFYQGFCNNTIWPLFHYFPSMTSYQEENWKSYNYVNEKFLEAIMEIIKPGDILWIHDYHLMLLPKLVREKMPGIKIGFFLHIPFPTYEVFSIMPSKWRGAILEGLLGSDIAGFHTDDYTSYFVKCVERILGLESEQRNIMLDTHICKTGFFPMGIDYQKFHNALNDDDIKKYIADLKNTLSYEKIILSIDRLDYTKGILKRLEAYELFLEQNPQWHDRVILVLRIIPSRIDVKHYGKTKKQIDQVVGHINGKFGKIGWSPISYQYDFLPFKPLVALYAISDVILVTPLRDGMNLISKEYLACRIDKKGVLVLSEMAGSSKELGEAVIINPNNVEEISSAITEAINMPESEQMRRNSAMQQRLKDYDVVRWAQEFINKIA